MNENLLKIFARYVSLSMLAMISVALLIFVDTLFISRALGANGLAALNFAIPVYSVVNGFGHMLGTGGGARYSLLKAAGQEREAQQVFSTTLVLAAIFSLISVAAGFVIPEAAAALLGAEGPLLSMTAAYIRPVLFLGPVLIFSNGLGALLRNDGHPKTAMAGTVILSGVNITLDYLFLFVFGWGMAGAALATMLGSLFHLIYLLQFWLRKKSNLSWRMPTGDFGRVKRIFLTGAPTLVGELSSAIILTAFNLTILGLVGHQGVAAFGIISNLAFVTIAMFNGLGQGMQPLASTYFGKGDQKSLGTIRSYSLKSVGILALAVYGIAFFFTDGLIAIFNGEGDLYLAEMAHRGIQLYFIGFLFVGFNIVSIIFLSVTSAPRVAFILSLLRGGIVILPVVLILGRLWGIDGVWASYPVAEGLIFLLGGAALVRYGKVSKI